MLKIKRVGAALPAQDIKRARQFYEQKLGLKPSEEMQDGSVYYVFGETNFSVFPSMGKASGDHTQIAFDVDDVGEAVRELKRAGDGVATEVDAARSRILGDTPQPGRLRHAHLAAHNRNRSPSWYVIQGGTPC